MDATGKIDADAPPLAQLTSKKREGNEGTEVQALKRLRHAHHAGTIRDIDGKL